MPVSTRAHVSLLMLIGLSTIFFCGCGSSENGKTSLYEVDHTEPPHWPEGLADLAVKLRERVESLGQEPAAATNVATEIEDLVSWVGEIAADTDLPEADWDPLYESSQALLVNVRAAQGDFSVADRQAILKHCDEIELAVSKIPTRFAVAEDASGNIADQPTDDAPPTSESNINAPTDTELTP